MYKLASLLIFLLSITSYGHAQIFITSMPDCSKVTFYEDNITIGSCRLHVYKAETDQQKICGMLNFTDDTFIKDGMIFTGNEEKNHYFHTEGMKMDIRIMGIVKTSDNNTYKVYNNDAKYSPPGIKSVIIYGNAVFETSEKKYQGILNKCLFNLE
ncbi:MAG TPA: hypothetical protein H9804_07980 [Candidatus Mucispirillum faecigallinarum]|uniref:Organic solvent tolerance-like N-terminal domain-containing protein n=1 Tax=Candidatus Mucispirillum faecigallinarum TaxID=2838699 RepID=A0A9D2KBK8_9BACT|nr:hypothetical protein [Candidatus Mucispirillum faecigallinarum]